MDSLHRVPTVQLTVPSRVDERFLMTCVTSAPVLKTYRRSRRRRRTVKARAARFGPASGIPFIDESLRVVCGDAGLLREWLRRPEVLRAWQTLVPSGLLVVENRGGKLILDFLTAEDPLKREALNQGPLLAAAHVLAEALSATRSKFTTVRNPWTPAILPVFALPGTLLLLIASFVVTAPFQFLDPPLFSVGLLTALVVGALAKWVFLPRLRWSPFEAARGAAACGMLAFPLVQIPIILADIHLDDQPVGEHCVVVEETRLDERGLAWVKVRSPRNPQRTTTLRLDLQGRDLPTSQSGLSLRTKPGRLGIEYVVDRRPAGGCLP